MGTRALIRYKGKDLVATHWDGYPEGLGKELMKSKDTSKETILKIAEGHTIDFMDLTAGKEQSKERKKKIKEKQPSNIMSAGDWEITSINNYGDWAEWIYDIRTDGVYIAQGSGSYDKEKTYTFEKLTPKFIKKCKEGD